MSRGVFGNAQDVWLKNPRSHKAFPTFQWFHRHSGLDQGADCPSSIIWLSSQTAACPFCRIKYHPRKVRPSRNISRNFTHLKSEWPLSSGVRPTPIEKFGHVGNSCPDIHRILPVSWDIPEELTLRCLAPGCREDQGSKIWWLKQWKWVCSPLKWWFYIVLPGLTNQTGGFTQQCDEIGGLNKKWVMLVQHFLGYSMNGATD